MREFTSAELAEIFRRSQVCPLGAACHVKPPVVDQSHRAYWDIQRPMDEHAANHLGIQPYHAYQVVINWDGCDDGRPEPEYAVDLAKGFGLGEAMQEFARRVTA